MLIKHLIVGNIFKYSENGCLYEIIKIDAKNAIIKNKSKGGNVKLSSYNLNKEIILL